MKSVGPTNIESLPDDVLLKIFVDHLSAEEIYESARPVCCKWYQMTNTDSFIHSHLRRTEQVLLFQKKGLKREDTVSLELRHGRVKVSIFSFKFRDCRFYRGDCNGLVLCKKPFEPVCIVNPITKQSCLLPPTIGGYCRYCIAYAAPSMVHKVVTPLIHLCRILTVGVDNSWRSVSSEHLTKAAKMAFLATPLVTEGGFVHWCTRDNFVLTMDVETEVIKETPPPFPQVDGQRRAYLSTGKYLSLLVSCAEYLWEVWEMKPQTGEWRKVTNFSLEDVRSMFEPFGFEENEFIVPIGWLMYPQVLVFGFSEGNKSQVFPYNIVTRNIDSIELPKPQVYYTWCLHQSSLVRI